jgi:hypothetical protein
VPRISHINTHHRTSPHITARNLEENEGEVIHSLIRCREDQKKKRKGESKKEEEEERERRKGRGGGKRRGRRREKREAVKHHTGVDKVVLNT